MRNQVRLNRYERGIAEALASDFGYSLHDARSLVVRYIQVVRKLGSYDSEKDHAERLAAADRKRYAPDDWLERIVGHDAEREQDHGLPVERGTLYARVR